MENMKKKPWLKQYPEGIASEIEIPNKSLPDILHETTDPLPHKQCPIFFWKKNDLPGLLGISNGFAAAFQNNEVKKGDRVAIMLPNCPQYVIAYYGAL